MSVRGYELLADWSRHGTFANALEDVTSYVLSDPDIYVEYGRDQADAASLASTGKLTFALNNVDRSFSPENESSSIADKVVPGTPVQLLKTHQSATRRIFTGVIDDLDVDPNDPAKAATFDVLDAWSNGAGQLSTPLHSGLRTGDAIELVLDAVGWTGERDIDPGATYMRWWWEEGTDPADAIDRLVQSEGAPAIAYVQGGTFVFRDRHHRLARDASQTSQATFTHAVPAGSGPVGSFMISRHSFLYDHGREHIVNSVTFSVEQREPARVVSPGSGTGHEEVWSIDTPISIESGESLILDAQGTDPFFNAITPEAGTDYDANDSIDVQLSRTSGLSVALTITATSGDVVIPRLRLRAVPVRVTNTVRVGAEDLASMGKYGRRAWPGQPPIWANMYDAEAIAKRIVAVYADNRPRIVFSISNIGDDYLTQILDRRISDRITIINDEIGVSGDFIVERIKHSIRKLGIVHRVEFSCQAVEPVQPSNIFTFDVAGKGFNDGAFGVEGIDNPDNTFQFDVAGRGFNQGVFGT